MKKYILVAIEGSTGNVVRLEVFADGTNDIRLWKRAEEFRALFGYEYSWGVYDAVDADHAAAGVLEGVLL